MPREDFIRIRPYQDDWLGVAFSAAVGLGAGLFAGIVAGELFGKVNSERVRGAMGRLKRRPASLPEPHAVERAVQDALRELATTRHLNVRVHALGDGLVELTGTAPDAASRRVAGDTARTVVGAEVVVNRILVEGNDIPNAR